MSVCGDRSIDLTEHMTEAAVLRFEAETRISFGEKGELVPLLALLHCLHDIFQVGVEDEAHNLPEFCDVFLSLT